MVFTSRKIVPRNLLQWLKSLVSPVFFLGLFHTVIKIDKTGGSGVWTPSLVEVNQAI